MKSQLRNQFGERRGGRGCGGNITVLQILLLTKVAEVGGAHPVPGRSGLKVRDRSMAGEQRQGERTTQQNAPGEAATAAEMGTGDHKRCF